MTYVDIVIRLLFAILIGGIIGYEREFQNMPAGFRTHIMVCVGAAVISIIQLHSIEDTKELILKYPELQAALKVDIGRMGAQVITGVGFLGAGTIIQDKGSVRGLTTAATIWVVACIGLCVGLGYYFLSGAATVGVFFSLVLLKRFGKLMFSPTMVVEMVVEYECIKKFEKAIEMYIKKRHLEIKNVDLMPIQDLEENDLYGKKVYRMLAPKGTKGTKILREVSKLDGVINVDML